MTYETKCILCDATWDGLVSQRLGQDLLDEHMANQHDNEESLEKLDAANLEGMKRLAEDGIAFNNLGEVFHSRLIEALVVHHLGEEGLRKIQREHAIDVAANIKDAEEAVAAQKAEAEKPRLEVPNEGKNVLHLPRPGIN